MALSSWFSIPDVMDVMAALLESSPASELARDAQAVASTRVDWKETATEHVFTADLPGLSKEDVQVQIEDGRTLRISGERRQEDVDNSDTWHRAERSRGHFLRIFRLPENADLDRVTAKVDHGVLTVVVPKLEHKKEPVRRIKISSKL